jgi:nitrate reductase NapD
MKRKTTQREVDRRKFLNGRWTGCAERESDSFEIASILVQARPDRLDAAASSIAGIRGAAIFSVDPKGKLVVVVEAEDVGRIGEALNAISLMPDVLTASLVFHRTDESA